MSIFEKIREAKAKAGQAKGPAEKSLRHTEGPVETPESHAEGPAGTASASASASASAPEQPERRPFGLRMPLRRTSTSAIPADVIVRDAPPAEVEIGPFMDLSAAPFDDDDEDGADEDDEADDDEADEDGADDDDEIEESVPVSFGGFEIVEPPLPPEAPKRLRLRPMAVKPVKPVDPKPVQPVPSHGPSVSVKSVPTVPTVPKPTEQKPVISANSPLGRLKALSQPGEIQREKAAAEFGQKLMAAPVTPIIKATGLSMPRADGGTGGTGGTGLSPAAREFIATATVEKVYTVEAYLADWAELPDLDDNADDIDIFAFNQARRYLIERACDRIAQIFTTELDGLAITAAADPSVTEISNIVKLTFLRVKNAPGAYAMLDLADRAQLIKGMRAMAAKRNATVKGRKPGVAKEVSMHMESLGIGIDDDGMATGFDLLAFGD